MAAIRIDKCPICNGNHLMHKHTVCDDVSGKEFDILMCSDCGLHMTQQAPSDSDMAAYYPDKESSCYKPAKEKEDKWLEREKQRWYKEQVKIVQQGSGRFSGVVFELGSKQGFFGNVLRNKGWIIHAVESDKTARDYANDRFLLHIEDSKCFFDIKPRSYNIVVAWDTLGEATDMHRTLDKMSQLISSDGVIIVGFHNAASQAASHYGKSWSAWDAPRKRWHLTPESFERLVAAHQLEIVDTLHSTQRAAITAATSRWKREGKKSHLATWMETNQRKLTGKERETYITYILKHQ